MIRPFASLFVLLLLHAPALAQPPACTVPAGPLQALLCATPALREADRDLRQLEQALARTTPRPATIAARARAWQRMIETGETLPEALLDHYQSRQHELRELLRQDRAMRRLAPPNGVIPRPPLEQRCLGQVLSACRVEAAGLLVSEDRTARILFQLQRGFTEADGIRAGIVLLAETRGGWRFLGWAFEAAGYDAPVLHAQEGGLLLAAGGRRAGSGRGNAELLLQRRGTAWRDVELETWQEEAATRLPPGLEIRQAVSYDFGELAAAARLSREADANCCASGGTARLGFRLGGDALRLDTLELDAAARAALPAPGPLSCPAERAQYRFGGPQDFRGELRHAGPGAGADSDLLLVLRSGASGRAYWFRFAQAQGFGSISLLPVEEPGARVAEDGIQDLTFDDALLPQLGFHAVGAALEVSADPPRSGQAAPRHLFLPGIGSALHYGLLPQQAGQTGGERISTAFWTLDACR